MTTRRRGKQSTRWKCICTSNCWRASFGRQIRKKLTYSTYHFTYRVSCMPEQQTFLALTIWCKSHYIGYNRRIPIGIGLLAVITYGLLLMTLGPAWRLFVRCGTLFSSQIRGSCTIAAEPWLITLGCILRTTSRKNVICLCHATHRGKILLLHLWLTINRSLTQKVGVRKATISVMF